MYFSPRGLRTWAPVAIGLALAAGCSHPGRPTQRALSTGAEPTAQLTPAQVTDMQAALAQVMGNRGELGPAAAAYAEILKKDPKRADLWLKLAVLHDKQGKYDESLEFYRKAQALQPDSANLYCNLGYSYYLQQRWNESEQCLMYAVQLQPDHKRAWNNLGLALARTGRGGDAMTAFAKAGCRPADAHINLAYCLALGGSFPEARQNYEKALAIDAASDAARTGLENLNRIAARMNTATIVPTSATSGAEQ